MDKLKIKAVIFDCDGTLVDSEVLGARAMHEVAAKYGCSMGFDALVHSYTGRNMALNIETINSFSETPMPDDFATEVRAAMAVKFEQELKEIEGAKALRAHLRIDGLAAVFSSPRQLV